MELVPAPLRQFKHWSMWLGIAIGSFDALVFLLKTLGDIHLMSPTAVLAINAVLGFLIVPAKLIAQNIPITAEDKVDIVVAAAQQPLKDGEKKVSVNINNVPVPAKPKETAK